jgi:hypothetical protein
MRPALQALAARQGGVVTRRQCLAVGYTEVELRGLTAVHGPWVTVRRGVYAERSLWERLTGWDERSTLRDRAVHLALTTEHVMSHDSAARALGMPLLAPAHELSHLTRPGVGGSRTERGVKHHLTRIPLDDTVVVDGMEVTGPARTGVDIAREHGLAAGIVTLDHVLAHGTSRKQLEREVLMMWCWPGVRTAREAVARAHPGSESVGESLTRILVDEAGLGPAEPQFPVAVDGHVYWVDLLVGCHGVEFDGRQKLRSVENGGLADRPVEDLLWDERARQIAICGEGLGMSRVSWDELFGRARERTIERLRREYAVTVERFGTQLPAHLVERADRIRRTSPRRRSA